MQTYVAVVVNDFDENKNGLLQCKITGKGDNSVENQSDTINVYYTSPYNPRAGGGFVGTPNGGDTILIVRPDNSDEYFYMSTILGYDGGGTVAMNNLTGNDSAYSMGMNNRSVGLTNSRGAGLEITDEQRDDDVERTVKLKGSQGHRIQLTDMPTFDKVLISNDLGSSKIEITNQTYNKGKVSCDSVNIEAGKNLFMKSQGGMDVMVDSMGGMFNLVNYSSPITSVFAAPLKAAANAAIGTLLGGALGSLIDLSPGEVNLRSLKNRVHIRSGFSPVDPGYDAGFLGVFLRTGVLPYATWAGSIPVPVNPLGVIQLRSDGKVEIMAMTGIDMKTMAGNINIEAVVGTVNIKGLLTNLNPPIPFLPTTITMDNDEIEGNYLGII